MSFDDFLWAKFRDRMTKYETAGKAQAELYARGYDRIESGFYKHSITGARAFLAKLADGFLVTWGEFADERPEDYRCNTSPLRVVKGGKA